MGITSGMQLPIVDGEWSQYESGRSYECYDNAPSAVPAYLALMRRYNIGMLFWSLEPGVGTVNGPVAYTVSNSIQSWFPTRAAGYSKPDAFTNDYKCDYGLTTPSPGIGAGADVMRYFRRYSVKL